MSALAPRRRVGLAARTAIVGIVLLSHALFVEPVLATVPESRFFWDSQGSLGYQTGEISSADAGASFVATNAPPVPVPNVAFVEANAAGNYPYWAIYLGGPGGTRIAVGSYANAADPANASASQPVILVQSSEGICGAAAGSFDVLAVTFDPDGTVTSLAANFKYHCTGDTGWTHGWLRYKSALQVAAVLQTPPSTEMDFGDTGMPAGSVKTVTFENAGDVNVHFGAASLGGPQAAMFQVANDDCSGATLPSGSSCSLDVHFTPTAVGAAAASLSVPNGTLSGGRTLHLTGYGLLTTTLTINGPAGTVYTPNFAHVSAKLTPAPSQVGVPDAQIAFQSENVNYWAPIQADGSASTDIDMRVAGTHQVTAIFVTSHALGMLGSQSPPLSVKVGYGTVVHLAASPNPAGSADQVTVSAWVSTDQSAIPGGTFKVVDAFDGSTLGSIDLTSGSAIYVTRTFAAGDHVLTATYSGFGDFRASSSTFTLHVIPASGVSWGATSLAGPAYTWNYGNSLGRTVVSGSQRLHAAYATDHIGTKWATDSGPYAGAYYVKSTTGATWTTPFRVNPSTQHATASGLAASGSRVFVAWESQTKLIHYSNTAPRVLYVRVNTNHGASNAWKTAVRLSATTGRASFPTIAAAGTDVYIAWTSGNTGAIELSVSHDSGTTWKTTAIGSTTLKFADGYSGEPIVAVSGSTVGVTWLQGSLGGIGVRVSTNRGVTWNATTTAGSHAIGPASIAVRGSRIAIAWPTADDLVVRQRLSGVWAAPIVVAHLATGAASEPYSPVVVLQDPNRVGVAWAEERTTPANQVDLRWAESPNGGSLWFQTQTIVSANVSSSHRANDWPSVLWPAASTRQVMWNGWTANTTSFRLYFRSGSGAPVTPTVQAQVWQPSMTATGLGQDSGGGAGLRRSDRGRGPSSL